MRIRKGDKVQVLTGKHRGRQGEVMRAFPGSSTVVVDGVNMAKRHSKPRGATMQGGIIDKDMPLPVSAVAIVCSACGPTRIGVRFDEQGRKLRICRKCGGDL
ncbi:MAG: 50S ribosomal protein L24 [Acidimicrobiales bacterium]|jgi:large subunit ribosomal protein L24|nr:50S ribosomal protein L24 [Actinomycetota bacterium]MDA8184141.1 50S ribosomal protein L24 [Actinomycetota bacterium]